MKKKRENKVEMEKNTKRVAVIGAGPAGLSKVFLTVTETEQQAKIVVADNGNGIAASDLPHIFERMYQCDHSRSAKGNGLGLSIAKELVSIHKGTITAASVPGNGTTFIIILPKAL